MTDINKKKTNFSQRIHENMNSLYSYASRLTRNQADAEDLVAETATKAWSCVDSLEDSSRFKPWIFRIMHNTYISEYRKKSIRPDEMPYDETAFADSDSEVAGVLIKQPDAFLNWWANPEQAVLNKLLGDDLLEAIECLPESFRSVVTLINVEGLSYDEAAEVLNVSPGTIRSRMNRGRTLLQKALWQHAQDAGLIYENRMTECKQ